ncbi:MAG: hypothetical protein ABGY96_25140 [bacterium]
MCSKNYGNRRICCEDPVYLELIEKKDAASPEASHFFREELRSSVYASLDEAGINIMNSALIEELKASALGIGLPVGYFPGAGYEEIFQLFEAAAKKSAPVFVHVRDPGIVGIQEVIADVVTTGAPLHIVHINSMALGDIMLAIHKPEGSTSRQKCTRTPLLLPPLTLRYSMRVGRISLQLVTATFNGRRLASD